MYSGDLPSTSGLNDSQSSFYPHAAAPHHGQGPSTSRDAVPPPPSSVPPAAEDTRHSASPQYMEMTPVRVTNGGMEGGGREQLPMEESQGREDKERDRKNGEGVKKIPMVHKPFKTVKSYETYNVHKKIREFWPEQMRRVENMSVKYLREASRNQVLPLARVKKIMKIDENVQKQMIAADAPLLLSVASEMFIEELTLRSWEVTEEARRKTLQKQDVATASTRHDHMDFLIDIIPRTNIQPRPKEMPKMGGMGIGMGQGGGGGGGGQPQMVQFMRDGSSMSQLMMKGASIINDVGPSTSNQQEFSARLESGEEAQVIQIGKPIPLDQQTVSRLGLGPPLAPPTVHHSPQPSYSFHPSHSMHQPQHNPVPPSHQSHPPPASHPHHSHPSTSSSHLSTSSPHTQTTVRIPSHLMQNATSSYRGMRGMRGGRGGLARPMPPPSLSSQPGPSQSKN